MKMHSSSHVQTHNKQTLVIAAIASRCYVEAAVNAGYDVIAIDCFADVDTKQLAKSTYQVPLHKCGLHSKYVLDVIEHINVDDVFGFVYGAGFEVQPEALAVVAKKINVIGNTSKVISQCKAPDQFFAICDAHDVPHPKVSMRLPTNADGWLKKSVGGSGGTHIEKLSSLVPLAEKDIYFQRYQSGKAISCLFLANADAVQVVGFNELWLDANEEQPFRYGGAASQAKIGALAKAQLVRHIEQLTKALGLVGLNSCDVICDGDDVVVLEVNPRLSATVDLYQDIYPDLLAKHIYSCEQKALDCLNVVDLASTAHQVIYAEADMLAPVEVAWDDWVADIPESGMNFQAGMPICTVRAEASTVEEAKSLVQDRATILKQHFLNEWL